MIYILDVERLLPIHVVHPQLPEILNAQCGKFAEPHPIAEKRNSAH
jgi:hypothetical protein